MIRPFVRPRLKPSSNGGCNRRILLSELSTSSSFPACTMCSQLQLSPKTPKVQVAPKTPTPPMKQVEHPKRADRGNRYDETHLNGLSVASNSRQHIEKKCSRTTRTYTFLHQRTSLSVFVEPFGRKIYFQRYCGVKAHHSACSLKEVHENSLPFLRFRLLSIDHCPNIFL